MIVIDLFAFPEVKDAQDARDEDGDTCNSTADCSSDLDTE